MHVGSQKIGLDPVTCAGVRSAGHIQPNSINHLLPGQALGKHHDRKLEEKIKFSVGLVDAEDLKAAPSLSSAKVWKSSESKTTYFDTRKGDMAAAGATLRLEEPGDGATVMTFKTEARSSKGTFHHREIEVAVSGVVLSAFDRRTQKEIDCLIHGAGVQPMFTAHVRRQRTVVNCGDSRIGLVIDRGLIEIAKGSVPIGELELELELVSGAESDMIDLAIELARRWPLRLDFIDKRQKGLLAIGATVRKTRKTECIEIDRKDNLAAAMTIVLGSCAAQIEGNWWAFSRPDNPDAVHQLRVGLRRMLVALGLLERAAPSLGAKGLSTHVKAIATATGPARDLDVLVDALRSTSLDMADGCERDAFLVNLEKSRAEAYAEARVAIDGADASVTMLAIRKLIATGCCSLPAADPGNKRLLKGARTFARRALNRRQRQVFKLGKDIGSLSHAERHQLRIALKKLRYVSEFFGTLFAGPKTCDAYVVLVAALQDLLGRHNDFVTAERILRRVSQNAVTPSHQAPVLLREESVAPTELQKAWRKLKKSQSFWA